MERLANPTKTQNAGMMTQPPKGAASPSKHADMGESTINPPKHHRNRCCIPIKHMETQPESKKARIDGATPKKATHPVKKC